MPKLQRRRLLLWIAVGAGLVQLTNWLVPSSVPYLAAKDFVGALPGLLAFLGIGVADEHNSIPRTKPGDSFRLDPSFDTGIYGGLVGGLTAGGLLGWTYVRLTEQELVHLRSVAVSRPGAVLSTCGGLESIGAFLSSFEAAFNHWYIFAAITTAGTVTGLLFGALIQLGAVATIRQLPRDSSAHPRINELGGAVIGGIIAGALAGGMIGWYFGPMDLPFVDLSSLVGVCVLAAACIALGILFYDYRGAVRSVLRSLIAALLLTSVVGVLGYFAMQAVGIPRFFNCTGRLTTTVGGVLGGVVVGAMFGVLVGGTLLVYRIWEASTAPSPPTDPPMLAGEA